MAIGYKQCVYVFCLAISWHYLLPVTCLKEAQLNRTMQLITPIKPVQVGATWGKCVHVSRI